MKISDFAKKEYGNIHLPLGLFVTTEQSHLVTQYLCCNISIKYHIDINILDLILNPSCIHYDLESLQLEQCYGTSRFYRPSVVRLFCVSKLATTSETKLDTSLPNLLNPSFNVFASFQTCPYYCFQLSLSGNVKAASLETEAVSKHIMVKISAI